LAGIDQAAQRLQPLPVDVGGERIARDAALQLGGGSARTMNIARPPSRTAPMAWSRV
jgi:hypothetical protein